jgi:hypothetical protein
MLTLTFIPFSEIEHLGSDKRITKLLNTVKKNKVVVMQGRLKAEEEAELIQRTMEEVSKEFKGIELCTVYPQNKRKPQGMGSQLKSMVAKMFIGDMEGMTIIGPANVIKEIKRNPDKIELLTHNLKKRKSSSKVKKNGGK